MRLALCRSHAWRSVAGVVLLVQCAWCSALRQAHCTTPGTRSAQNQALHRANRTRYARHPRVSTVIHFASEFLDLFCSQVPAIVTALTPLADYVVTINNDDGAPLQLANDEVFPCAFSPSLPGSALFCHPPTLAVQNSEVRLPLNRNCVELNRSCVWCTPPAPQISGFPFCLCGYPASST